MKVLKKIRFSVFVAWIAAFVLAVSWVAGVNSVLAAADDTLPAEITYIETDVEEIEFVQHPTNVFFGFRLAESDYDDFGEFQGDFAGTDSYATYEKYVALWLTYWKNFSQMNSENAVLDQLYAYWDGSAVGAWFSNTVAHRSTLKLLEYGFVISIPAGTTFPSATYVHGGCEGTPIMYKTTEDRAFYYDGTEFKPLSYALAQERIDATEKLNAVDDKLYYEAERAEVRALVEAAKADIKLCLTSFAVQDRMATFYAALDEIMTMEDFAELARLKEEKKLELNNFFAGLSKDLYDSENWQKIVDLQTEGNAIIDSVTSFDEIDGAVAGVKFAVGRVPTLEQTEGFEAYRAAAVERISNAFTESLYRDAECVQGAALVQEGTQAVANATTYDAVDAISADYIAKIGALKTKAQWEAEEKAAAEQETEEEEDSSSEGGNVVIIPGDAASGSGKSGCGSAMGGIGMIFGVTVMAASVIIKKKAGKKDEE